MMVYLLFYSHDSGDAEDWNTFYTPVEAFSTPEYREARRLNLAALDPDLGFEERDVEVDATWP